MEYLHLKMTSSLRSVLCLVLVIISFNSAFAQGLFFEGNSLSNRFFNSDLAPSNTVFAVDFAITRAGTLREILSWGENSGQGIPGVGEGFHAYVLRPIGINFQVMTDSGALIVANIGTNVFAVPPFNLEAGDLIAHYGREIPANTGTGGPSISYFNGSALATPSVGELLQLPGPAYPLYNDGGRDYAIAVGVGELYALSIARSGGSVVVSWPATLTNSFLQTSDLAGQWTTNSSYVSINGTNVITITPPLGNSFFRLGND
jgi:hypothetical protein